MNAYRQCSKLDLDLFYSFISTNDSDFLLSLTFSLIYKFQSISIQFLIDNKMHLSALYIYNQWIVIYQYIMLETII